MDVTKNCGIYFNCQISHIKSPIILKVGFILKKLK